MVRLFFLLLYVVTLSLATFWFLLFHVRVGDRVLAVTNPPSVPPLLALVLRLRRARSVLLVHDVYPEALVAVGMMSPDSILARTMSRVMKATFAAYDRVVLLGEDMARLIAERRGVAREGMRTEERRVGKGWVRTWRSRWSAGN